MAAWITQVRHARKHREVVAKGLKRFQVARGLIIFARFFREKVWCVQSQRSANEEQAFRPHGCCPLLGPQADGQHGIEQRQTNANPGGSQEGAAVHWRERHQRNLLTRSHLFKKTRFCTTSWMSERNP